ncbi:hypothetical protein ACT6QG_05400 [Xanthobacter sp. TB0136]
MSILSRIEANGGSVTRDRWMPRLRPGDMSPAAIEWVKAHKDDLMREIWPLYDDWLERAAIREFDGGQSREEADAAAYDEIVERETAPCCN